jgi:hypothetical protein
MVNREFVQPIRGVVFDENTDRYDRLSTQFARLGGQVVFTAANVQVAENLLRANHIRPDTVDVAFIGSYGKSEARASDHILHQLLLHNVIRTAVGTRPLHPGSFARRHTQPIVTVGIAEDMCTSQAYGSYSDYLGMPLALQWSEPNLNLPTIMLEVMHLKPAENPRAFSSVQINV